MKDFVLLFRGGMDFATASPEQLQQNMVIWRDWMDGLAKDGKLAGAQRLERGPSAVIQGKNKQVIDGPYAEGKEIVGGFLAIKAENFEQAVEIAKGCPIFNFDGITEVREVASM